MRNWIKIGSILLMIVFLSSFAAAVQKPAVQQTGGTATQLVIGAQDVITASDAGGGLSSRDILIITALGVGLIILILVL